MKIEKIMKKNIYIKPQTDVVLVDVESHICTGSPDPNNPQSGLGNLGDGGDDPGDFSRSYDDWDD